MNCVNGLWSVVGARLAARPHRTERRDMIMASQPCGLLFVGLLRLLFSDIPVIKGLQLVSIGF